MTGGDGPRTSSGRLVRRPNHLCDSTAAGVSDAGSQRPVRRSLSVELDAVGTAAPEQAPAPPPLLQSSGGTASSPQRNGTTRGRQCCLASSAACGGYASAAYFQQDRHHCLAGAQQCQAVGASDGETWSDCTSGSFLLHPAVDYALSPRAAVTGRSFAMSADE